MKVLLNAKQIEQILKKLTTRIVADTPDNIEIAIIGIRRGEIVARWQAVIQKTGGEIPAARSICLYRDDLNSPKIQRRYAPRKSPSI
jgi:pyrimidine operon attenuation protein/uracil phosphoribosyltransferase